ncbi:pyruvate formate lyase family protein, partial [Streptobacillus felis]|uniref:pyruvate formate lyase family protein n=1 Tax=Streptobacillus felis TaxID=1384509 RepID=UPI0039BF65D8
MTFKASISHIDRYVDLIDKLILEEKDENRRKEVKLMLEVSKNISRKPANNFIE